MRRVFLAALALLCGSVAHAQQGSPTVNPGGSAVSLTAGATGCLTVSPSPLIGTGTVDFGAAAGNCVLGSAQSLNWNSDAFIYRDAANILAHRNGTAAQTLRIYNTFNGNDEFGVLDWITSANVFAIGTRKTGTGVARAIQFVTGGVNIFQITTAGHINYTTDNAFDIGANNGTSRPRNLFLAGYIQSNDLQSTKTGNYGIAATDMGTIFNNIGAAGEVDFTLPAALAGRKFGFCVQAAQTLKVIALASTTISIGATTSAAAGNIQANVLGACVFIEATDATHWMALSHEGTWTVT